MSMHFSEFENMLVKKFGQTQVNEWIAELQVNGGQSAMDAFHRGDLDLLKEVIGDHKGTNLKLLLG